MRARLFSGFLGFWVISTAVTAGAPPTVPEAASKYLQILEKRPRTGTLFERFYAAWLEQSSADELREYLKTRAAASGAKPADHLLLAVFHAHRGEDREALTAYEAALSADPADPAAWMERARLESRGLDFAAALKSLDEALKHQPEPALSVEIGKLRGRALLRLGKNDEALKVWKELAAAHAQDEDLAEEIIDLLADEGQYEAAIEAARALVEKSRDAVAKTLRRMRLADILVLADQRDEALKTLREALAATGADSWVEGDVLGRMSRVLRMSDDADGLEKLLAALVKEHPQRVTLAWQHTQLLAETGQKDAALASARALLASNPGRRDLQEGFLDLLDGLGLIAEAVEQARVLTTQNAEDKELRVRLATLQQRAKDEKGAQETLAAFLTMKGTGETEHLRVARLLESWETPPAKPGSPAELAYARLVELFPASMGAQEARASYLHRAGRREEALAVWRQLGKSAGLEDLLRIGQALTTRLETRAAMDLLVTREAEFGKESRFLAQLVQLGIANKETERALPWARTRLELARDAEGIDAALKDLATLLRDESKPERAETVRTELRTKKPLTIQERCLLALLTEAAAEAEKLLMEAAEADKLIALGRVVTLHQEKQDWEKAAQVMQALLELPGARTTARVQRMVDFYRRAQQSEKALPWIAEWKKLSPSAVQPWLDESRLLTELGRAKEALENLRAAARKFPDSVEAVSALAVLCMESGRAEEAETVYLALYEKTTDNAARQRLLGPLAMAAQTHNALPRLVEQFQQRQRQNRASAQPWLALAEIHRVTHNDEERRRCLYEASRLRPQDLDLLLEIARSEEELGLTQEALRTLATAEKLDKTTKTRENIARVQIDSGDADAGWRMLFELAGGDHMDARGIEKIADTIAEKGDWERVVSFLEPLLVKHPKDYRLHYLLGIALEEGGRERDAVRVFLSMLDMHEELPGVLHLGRRVGIREQYARQNLPPGAEDWLALPSMMQMAYYHRQKQGQGRGYSSGYFGNQGGNGLPQGFIEHAPGVTESPVLALAHVLQIAALWDAEERGRLAAQLTRAGVTDAALLLEAATESPQMLVTLDMLAAHPQNVTLHAVWLAQFREQDAEDVLPALENAWKLFHADKDERAFGIALRGWRVAGEKAPAWMTRLLEMAESLPKANAGVSYSLIHLITSGIPPEAAAAVPKLSAEDERRLTECVLRWHRTGEQKPGYYDLGSLSAMLVKTRRWAELVEVLEAELNPKAVDPASTAQTSPSQVFNRRSGRVAVSIQSQPYPWPPGFNSVLSQVTNRWLSSYEMNLESIALPEPDKVMQEGLRPFIAASKDPRLTFVLRLMCREFDALRTEAASKAEQPSAPQEQLLTAAWLAQLSRRQDEAVAWFTKALSGTQNADQKQLIENALLFNAQRFIQSEPDEKKTAAVRTQMKALLDEKAKTTTHPEALYSLSQVMNAVGLTEEAEALERTARSASNSASRSPRAAIPPVANPYSQNYISRSRSNARVEVAKLLQDGKRDQAVQEMVKKTRAALQQLVSAQNGHSGHYQLHEAIKEYERHMLTDDVKAVFRKAAEAGWRPRLEWALLQEHAGPATGISDEAIAEHQAILALNPRAQESRMRLAVLLAMKGDIPAALTHWRALPAMLVEQHLPAVMSELSERSEISIPEPRALSGLLSGWLRGLDANRPLSQRIPQHLHQALEYLQRADTRQKIVYPSLYEPWRDSPRDGGSRQWKSNPDGSLLLDAESAQERAMRRAAHDDLCRAMIQVPELAFMGFSALAGVALYDGTGLDEVEKTALDLLARFNIPKVKRRLATNTGYSDYDALNPTQNAFVTPDSIAKPSPAFFAVHRAAQRGDTRALEETVLPAITRVHGVKYAARLRAYAALLMAKDADFVTAAKAWIQAVDGTNPAMMTASHQRGGVVTEIIRQWQQRKIAASLDELFPTPETDLVRRGFYNLPDSYTAYLMALRDRDPAQMRDFARRMRDGWIGTDRTARREAVAAHFAAQKNPRSMNGRSRQPTVQQQAVQYYAQWLQNILADSRALPLLELALEDGFDVSPGWMRRIAYRHSNGDRSDSPETFLKTARAIGFLNEAAHFRPYNVSESVNNPETLLGNFARSFRESADDARINATLELLGKEPRTLGTELMQALLVKNNNSVLWLDGKRVSFDSAEIRNHLVKQDAESFRSDDSSAYRRAALALALTRHAKELSILPGEGQQELSMLLRTHLAGYPQPENLGEDLTRLLAPLLKNENTELVRQVDHLLAAKSWNDVGQQEYSFSQQMPVLLKDLARIDPAKAEALARHAIVLLRGSPEQREARAQRNSETATGRLLYTLAQVPQLLSVVFELAEADGLTRSSNWCSNLRSQVEQLAHQKEQAVALFTRTPFVADMEAFRDLPAPDSNEPTTVAQLINAIENNSATAVAVRDHLAKQPATFGTELLQALLHRGKDDAAHVRSFYNSKRPDDSALTAFLLRRAPDFAKLQPQTAACLYTMLRARFPDWKNSIAARQDLVAALKPLVEADERLLDEEVTRFTSATSFDMIGMSSYEAKEHAARLLDRVARQDRARALLLLDQTSRLLATEDLRQGNGMRRPARETLVGQWLQRAAQTPEIFAAVMERAEKTGATKDAEWMKSLHSSVLNIHHYRGDPARLLMMMEALHMLDTAAAFDPCIISTETRTGKALSLMGGISGDLDREARYHPGLVDALKERPRTFGTALVLLLCSSRTHQEVVALGKEFADEIATTSSEQQARIAAIVRQMGWSEMLAPVVPALEDELGTELKQREEQRMAFVRGVQQMTNWSDIEGLYMQSQGTDQTGIDHPMRMGGAMSPFYQPGTSTPSLAELAKQIVMLSTTDTAQARKTLEHVLELCAKQFPANASVFQRPSVEVFLKDVCASPAMLVTVFGFIARRPDLASIHVNRMRAEEAMISSTFPEHVLADARKTAIALTETGLLVDAAAFDTVPLHGNHKSLLELVMWRLRRTPEQTEQRALAIEQSNGAVFGHHLVAALLTNPESPQLARRIETCAKAFRDLRPETVGALMGAFSKVYPDLIGQETPTESTQVLAPLFAKRASDERAWLDAILAGNTGLPAPYRGEDRVTWKEAEKLVTGGKMPEALRLIRMVVPYFEKRTADAVLNTSDEFRRSLWKVGELLQNAVLRAGEPEAILACLLQAAAEQPEVRVLSPTWRVENYYDSQPGILFPLWERLGGRAAPGLVFDQIVRKTAQHGIQNTATLWLPLLHELLVHMSPEERAELAAWAAKEASSSLSVVAGELSLASTLLEATRSHSANPRGSRMLDESRPPASKQFSKASQQAVDLLEDQAIKPHARLALAAFLIATYPGLLDDAHLAVWGQAAAQAWHDGAPITQFELQTVLTAASCVPDSPGWRATRDLVLTRWAQREKVIVKSSTRYVHTGMHSLMLRFAARSQDLSTLKPFKSSLASYDYHHINGILLECGDGTTVASLRLRDLYSTTRFETESRWWLPPAPAALESLRAKAGEEPALLAEVLALSADDRATRRLFPNAAPPPREKRLESFAKKLSTLALPEQGADRMHVLVALAEQHPPAAITLIPQYEALVARLGSSHEKKEDFEQKAWIRLNAAHAALRAVKGDLSLADKHLSNLIADTSITREPSREAEVEKEFCHFFFHCLTSCWSAGLGRDPAKVSPMSILAHPNARQPAFGEEFISAPIAAACMEAWSDTLAGKPLPDARADQSLRVTGYRSLLSFIACTAGTGKSRMSFDQRLETITRIAARSNFQIVIPRFWATLVEKDVFTTDELVRQHAKISTCLHLFQTSHIADYVQLVLQNAPAADALLILNNLSATARQGLGDSLADERAALLIRLKQYDEARSVLEGSKPGPSEIKHHEALLKLIPP